MTLLLQGAVLAAALVFIAVSAMMNALFLSSLGRTPIEICLLAAVSVAADITKAALPVVLVRAVVLRAWGQTAVVAVLLLFVVLLSLASGTGFAALTRSGTTAAREAQSDHLGRLRKQLAEVEAKIAGLSPSRPAAVVEAHQTTMSIDRRWQASKLCTEISGAATREFCGEAMRLQAERVTAGAHEELTAERARLTAAVEELERAGAASEADPQSAAIAELFGIDRRWPRVALTSSIAIMLEIGSIFLVLVAAGPTLRGWREPGSEPKPEPIAVTLPVQADRSHWHRQRGKSLGIIGRVDGDGR